MAAIGRAGLVSYVHGPSRNWCVTMSDPNPYEPPQTPEPLNVLPQVSWWRRIQHLAGGILFMLIIATCWDLAAMLWLDFIPKSPYTASCRKWLLMTFWFTISSGVVLFAFCFGIGAMLTLAADKENQKRAKLSLPPNVRPRSG
jgi:hypothetical protein